MMVLQVTRYKDIALFLVLSKPAPVMYSCHKTDIYLVVRQAGKLQLLSEVRRLSSVVYRPT